MNIAKPIFLALVWTAIGTVPGSAGNGTPGTAGELPTKRRTTPEAPFPARVGQAKPFSWTGFYGGAQLGGRTLQPAAKSSDP